MKAIRQNVLLAERIIGMIGASLGMPDQSVRPMETSRKNPDWYSWIDFFLSASQRMAKNLLQKLEDIDKLATNGLRLINSENNTIHKIWLYTFSNPFCTAKEVAEGLEITPQTARKHLKYLADRGVLELDQSKKRNQLFVNYDLLSMLN